MCPPVFLLRFPIGGVVGAIRYVRAGRQGYGRVNSSARIIAGCGPYLQGVGAIVYDLLAKASDRRRQGHGVVRIGNG